MPRTNRVNRISSEAALEAVEHLARDVVQALSSGISRQQARYLVDAYYDVQEYRIATGNQLRALHRSGEPAQVCEWLHDQFTLLERSILRALDRWTDGHLVGRWSKRIIGIGPVIAAGLLAHIDPERAVTAGDVWRYAGLDPTVRWERGQKRPWNARLKSLCWKIGESFVKSQSHPESFYGPLYRARREYEERRNHAGDYAEQARAMIASGRARKGTVSYEWYVQGMLPPGHIYARAKRWTVKLFLSHWQRVAYLVHHGTEPPLPYVITQLRHAHVLDPPYYDWVRAQIQAAN